jgi:hypothetical protein
MCTIGFIGYCDCFGEESRTEIPLDMTIPWPDDNREEQLLRSYFIQKSEYSMGSRPVNFQIFETGVYGNIDLFIEYVESGIAAKDYDRLIEHRTIEFHRLCDVNSPQFTVPIIRDTREILPTSGVSSSQSATSA